MLFRSIAGHRLPYRAVVIGPGATAKEQQHSTDQAFAAGHDASPSARVTASIGSISPSLGTVSRYYRASHSDSPRPRYVVLRRPGGSGSTFLPPFPQLLGQLQLRLGVALAPRFGRRRRPIQGAEVSAIRWLVRFGCHQVTGDNRGLNTRRSLTTVTASDCASPASHHSPRSCWWRWRLIGCVEVIFPEGVRLLLDGNAFR